MRRNKKLNNVGYKMKDFFYKLFQFLKAFFSTDVILNPTTPPPTEPVVSPLEKPMLWCPFAEYSQHHDEKGYYLNGYPVGAVVHATAGQDRNDQDAIDTIQWGKEKGYSFFMIAPSGKIFQTMPLNKWGSHCGKSSYPGLGSDLSSKLVGIEVACAGLLEATPGGKMWRSWFGKEYLDMDNHPSDQVRAVTNSEYGCPTGHYKMFTKEQEDSLIKLLYWLKKNNPMVFSVDYVLGHHEISPDRKSDPGGSLSIPMKDLRAMLRKTVS